MIPGDWLRPHVVPAGCGMLMTTRLGGRSEGRFASMNTRLDVGDAAAAVAANRRILAAACGAQPLYLRQVHGKAVVRLGAGDSAADAALPTADAAVTAEPGVACVVEAADCLPVLFAGPDGRAVGAAHAGWRGLAAGVLEATVEAVCEIGRCEPPQLVAWLGACIGPRRFEVGRDVAQAFGIDPDRSSRFVAFGPAKWLADLAGLARDRLAGAGVVTVSGGEWCTASDPARFFSYRRDGITGRMAAAVWIERAGAAGA